MKTARKRLDLYAECNIEPRAPLDVFTAECCARCVNPECTRSNFGNSKFEDRVMHWHERLFTDVPRMAPDDGRFGQIAGQKFLLIDPASAAAPSSWVDPRDLEAPTRIVVPEVAVARPEPEPELKIAPAVPEPPLAALSPTVEAATPPPPQAQLEPKRPASQDLAFANTPAKQGQMLGNRPQPRAQDWQSPAPAEPASNAKVVKTGAKIKIGS